MCWAFAKTSLVRGACVCVAIATLGCARPEGELFPAMQPAMVWPGPPEQARIRLVGSIASSEDLHAATSASEALASALRGARPPVRFVAPHGVAVSGDELVAVTDSAGASVHILDLQRREHVVVSGFEDARFVAPVGVAWAKDALFVSDAGLHEVVGLGRDGAFRIRFGGNDLQRPVGIAYAASRDQLLVVDGDAHQIKVFSTTGEMLNSLGQRGEAPGEFNFPSHLAVWRDRIVVADSGNLRVQVLTLDGSPVATIGKKGNAAGDFALPKGVAVDAEGHVYVVDARFENVQIFDQRGALLLAVGEEGSRLGQFSLPAGIAIDAQNRIWVADSGNRRLQVFQTLRNAS